MSISSLNLKDAGEYSCVFKLVNDVELTSRGAFVRSGQRAARVSSLPGPGGLGSVKLVWVHQPDTVAWSATAGSHGGDPATGGVELNACHSLEFLRSHGARLQVEAEKHSSPPGVGRFGGGARFGTVRFKALRRLRVRKLANAMSKTVGWLNAGEELDVCAVRYNDAGAQLNFARGWVSAFDADSGQPCCLSVAQGVESATHAPRPWLMDSDTGDSMEYAHGARLVPRAWRQALQREQQRQATARAEELELHEKRAEQLKRSHAPALRPWFSDRAAWAKTLEKEAARQCAKRQQQRESRRAAEGERAKAKARGGSDARELSRLAAAARRPSVEAMLSELAAEHAQAKPEGHAGRGAASPRRPASPALPRASKRESPVQVAMARVLEGLGASGAPCLTLPEFVGAMARHGVQLSESQAADLARALHADVGSGAVTTEAMRRFLRQRQLRAASAQSASARAPPVEEAALAAADAARRRAVLWRRKQVEKVLAWRGRPAKAATGGQAMQAAARHLGGVDVLVRWHNLSASFDSWEDSTVSQQPIANLRSPP